MEIFNEKILSFILLPFLINFAVYVYLNGHLYERSDIKSCPYCLGKTLCADFQQRKIVLEYESFLNVFYNLFSVKRVYFANYNNKKVVLKEVLFDNRVTRELKNLHKNTLLSKQDKLIKVNNESDVNNFKLCDNAVAELLYNFLKNNEHHNFEGLLTILKYNSEPLLLSLFESSQHWAVPKYFGSCGSFMVVENKGQSLNSVLHGNWIDRAYIALQILDAVRKFTLGHEQFRLYLTDISSDNIVVDDNMEISFIDLENGILARKNPLDNASDHHKSSHILTEDYAFSTREICDSSLSDHNIYSACYLLLSKEAPWPMVENGLLHSVPKKINQKYPELFLLIDYCVTLPDTTNDRFNISLHIVHILKDIILGSVYKNKITQV